MFLTAVTSYCIMFLIYVKRFKQALLQIAIERLAQYRSNGREMKQYRYFSYTTNYICTGLSFILTALYIGIISRFMITLIFFNKCNFPLNLLPQFSFGRGSTKVFMAFYYLNFVSTLLAYTGGFLVTSPLIFITISIWIISAYKKIRGKSSAQFRYKFAQFEEENSMKENDQGNTI